MKKQMIRSAFVATSVRTFLGLFLAAVLLIVPGFHSAAQDVGGSKPVISYLGKVNNQPVVQVEIENNEEKPLQISIHDAHRVLLYTTEFNGKKFSKKFQIAQDQPENIKLILTVSSGKSRETQVVELNRSTYVKEEFSVTKL